MNNLTPNTPGWRWQHSFQTLPPSLWTAQQPEQYQHPQMVMFNHELASALGLNAQALAENAALFAGKQIPDGAAPIALAYCGHQFGGFTRLGDGRAVLLGEHKTPDGSFVDIQFKGSGRTPFSRSGDGRAVLAPMLREYLVSEAMAALGIPTTRSLAVVTTGEEVFREQAEMGAVLTRVAASHIRVGTFQGAVFASVAGSGADENNREVLQKLADYTMQRHYPDLKNGDYADFLAAVVKRQAELIAQWMSVGFIHGVMNTDNVSIAGETIDYGPCAFMDEVAWGRVLSSIDRGGRYAYGNQPNIGQWNLARFAETLLPLLHADQNTALTIAENILSDFAQVYTRHWKKLMLAKLGIVSKLAEQGNEQIDAQDEVENEELRLISDWLEILEEHGGDFTNSHLGLMALLAGDPESVRKQVAQGALHYLLDEQAAKDQQWQSWFQRWQKLVTTKEQALSLMSATNPRIIPRNHRVEQSLRAAEKGDMSLFERLLAACRQPYADLPECLDLRTLPLESERVKATYCGT